MIGQMIGRHFRTLARYSAFIGIIGTWLVFIVGMAHTDLKLLDSRPLSYLGISSFAPYFKIGLVTGVCLMAAFYIYLQKTFVPSRLFKVAYFLGLSTQIIVALTPYQANGAFQWVHWTAAIILAVVLVCAPWLFSASQNISVSVKRISKGVTKLYLMALVIETVLLLTLKYYVISELINLIIFDLWIIYITFLPTKSEAM